MFENRNKLLVFMMILVIFTLQACSTNSGLGENNKVEINGEGEISDKDKTVLTYGCYRLTGTSAENAVKSITNDLQENEILLYEGFLFGGLGSYLMARQMFGEEITLIGYPSPQGAGARLIPQVLLGINSASGNIDASWEFVSSFLTREFQLSYTHLSASPAYPLMEEALDKVLEDELAPNPYASEIPAQEDKEAVKSFLETANYLVWGEREQVIGQIIGEEAPSYWEGNKTAEETAAVIQNRVQNYLSERE